MKRIWRETITVAKYQTAWVYEGPHAAEVIRDHNVLIVSARGWFDRKTKTLRVELAAMTSRMADEGYFSEPFTQLMTLERDTREHATRCVIELVEHYVRRVKAKYAANPLDQSNVSDQNVLAAWNAKAEAEAEAEED